MKAFNLYIVFFLVSFVSFSQGEGQEENSINVVVEKKDTTKVFFKTLAKTFGMQPYTPDEKPRIAFVRSLFLPGWGQFTNRDYWKMGVVYAAAGAGWYYGIRANNIRYKRYLGHYEKATFYNRDLVFYDDSDLTFENLLPPNSLFYVSDETDNNDTFYLQTLEGVNYTLDKKFGEVEGVETTYFTVQESDVIEDEIIGAVNINTFESAKNQYRKWRDASIIGVAAGWLFFALEANVAAHLKTFDMSENISWKLEPAGPNTFGTHASGIKLSFVLE